MRKGQNPAKMGLQAHQASRLGVLLPLYIPTPGGYYANSLDIFKYQLASLYQNTSQEFDLLVFDNGSCQVVKDALQKLQSDGWIDWLILSRHNIGKTGAMNWGFRALQNELICYSDADVYFRPGWFDQSLEILNTFPHTGMVTAQPCFYDCLAGKGQAHLVMQAREQFPISDQPADAGAMEEYVHSIGDIVDLQGRYNHHIWRIINNPTTGVEAIIGASHFQFMAYKSLLEQITPLPAIYGLNRKDDYHIISRIDQIGFLQLSTLKPYVYHMGNNLDDITREDIQRDGTQEVLLDTFARSVTAQGDQISRVKKVVLKIFYAFSRFDSFSNLLLRIYNFLFEDYTREK